MDKQKLGNSALLAGLIAGITARQGGSTVEGSIMSGVLGGLMVLKAYATDPPETEKEENDREAEEASRGDF